MKLLQNTIITFAVGLKAVDKWDVVRQISQETLRPTNLSYDQVQQAASSIMKREELGSTGIGRGVAVPHTKFDTTIDRVLVGCFSFPGGVDFNSLDADSPSYKPVDLVFCAFSPPGRPIDHLRVLETISYYLRDDCFVGALRAADSADDMRRVFAKYEENDFR